MMSDLIVVWQQVSMFVKIHSIVSRMVKAAILPHLQANALACRCLGYQQTTWDSWVRDEGLITHTRSSSQSSISIFLCRLPEPQFPHSVVKSGNTCTHSGLHYRNRRPSLGNMILLKRQEVCLPFPREGALSLILKAVSKPVLCSMKRHYFYLLTSLKRLSRKKAIRAVLVRFAEMQETHGELFPNKLYTKHWWILLFIN